MTSDKTKDPQAAIETGADLLSELAGFTGSMEWHRFNIDRRHLLTDGALYLAEKAQAFWLWLMDVIASYQHEAKFRAENFQVWTIQMDATPDRHGCVIFADDGNGNELCRQSIEYTDFPDLSEVVSSAHTQQKEHFKLFAARNELGGVTIMLPSEN